MLWCCGAGVQLATRHHRLVAANAGEVRKALRHALHLGPVRNGFRGWTTAYDQGGQRRRWVRGNQDWLLLRDQGVVQGSGGRRPGSEGQALRGS